MDMSPSRTMPAIFEYSVTRPVTLRYFTPAVLVLGVMWISFITFVNVVVVGYDYVPLVSTSFNTSKELWYEEFMPKSWAPNTRYCAGSTIKIDADLATNGRNFGYKMRGFLDTRGDSPIDGMIYYNNPLKNCSVQTLQISQSLLAAVEDNAVVACNTSAEEYFVSSAPRNEANPLSLDRLELSPADVVGPTMNVTSIIPYWAAAARGVLNSFGPDGGSVLLPSLQQNNLSALQFSYDQFQGETANTPAKDHWTMIVSYTLKNEISARSLNITFLSTGQIDFNRTSQIDYSIANNLLEPITSLLQAYMSNDFDFWELANWLFVSIYWTYLADLGQVRPTTYVREREQYGIAIVDFSRPTSYPLTNNIFINDTLFEIYSSYLRTSIFPFLNYSLPEFYRLDDDNHLKPVDMMFGQSYSCSERQLKTPLNFIISVLAADYVLVIGAYRLIIFLAALIQRQRRQANYCEGCLLKDRYGRKSVIPEDERYELEDNWTIA